MDVWTALRILLSKNVQSLTARTPPSANTRLGDSPHPQTDRQTDVNHQFYCLIVVHFFVESLNWDLFGCAREGLRRRLAQSLAASQALRDPAAGSCQVLWQKRLCHIHWRFSHAQESKSSCESGSVLEPPVGCFWLNLYVSDVVEDHDETKWHRASAHVRSCAQLNSSMNLWSNNYECYYHATYIHIIMIRINVVIFFKSNLI